MTKDPLAHTIGYLVVTQGPNTIAIPAEVFAIIREEADA
jgi:hypothetical protein